MLYRKRPVEIEAKQFLMTEASLQTIREFTGQGCKPIILDDCAYRANAAPPMWGFVLHTLEGDHVTSPGDYIIKGVAGEFYPCKANIFKQTYEEV